MSRAGERTIIIEPLYTEAGEMVADEGKLDAVLRNLAGTLTEVGGRIEVMADRVKIGELPGAHDGERPTILAETVGYIVRYAPSAPLNEQSITRNAMAVARRDEPEPDHVMSPAEALEGAGEE